MSLNQDQQITLKRQKYHDQARRQNLDLRLTKRRVNLTSNLHSFIWEGIQNEKTFNPESFETLLHIMREDTDNGYIMLGNYMCDYSYQTSSEVFDIVRNMKSNKVNFSWVVRLSLESPNVNYVDVLQNIHDFLESENLQIVQYGCLCIIVLLDKGEYQTVIKLQNLKWVTEKYFWNDDKNVSSKFSYILEKLLLNKQTRYRIFSNSTLKMLSHLLAKNSKCRERALGVLKVLYGDFEMHLEDTDLVKELIFLYNAENGRLLPLISDVWVQFIKYQSLSSIKLALHCGLKSTICPKLLSQDIIIIHQTLSILDNIYDILSTSGEGELLSSLINFFDFNFQLSSILQRLMDHENQKISARSSAILDAYYTFKDQEDIF